MANQDNKHRMEDISTYLSVSTNRNGVGEVLGRSRSMSTFTSKYGGACRDGDTLRLRKSLKGSKRISHVENVLSVILYTIHHKPLQ